ncbi:MAG: hypothetical protein AAFQ80_05430 [Cyanobacteria bacterium J06621_8]
MCDEKFKRTNSILNDENLTKVVAVAYRNNVQVDVALNRIVTEWAEGGKIERLKMTSESTELSRISEKLNLLLQTVDAVEDTVNHNADRIIKAVSKERS